MMNVYKLIFWLNHDILLHWSYFSKFCILCNCLIRFRYHITNTNTIQKSFLLKIKRTFICLSTVYHIELCSDDMFTKLIILCRIWGLHCTERGESCDSFNNVHYTQHTWPLIDHRNNGIILPSLINKPRFITMMAVLLNEEVVFNIDPREENKRLPLFRVVGKF